MNWGLPPGHTFDAWDRLLWAQFYFFFMIVTFWGWRTGHIFVPNFLGR